MAGSFRWARRPHRPSDPDWSVTSVGSVGRLLDRWPAPGKAAEPWIPSPLDHSVCALLRVAARRARRVGSGAVGTDDLLWAVCRSTQTRAALRRAAVEPGVLLLALEANRSWSGRRLWTSGWTPALHRKVFSPS
jgi:hypothetical protein